MTLTTWPKRMVADERIVSTFLISFRRNASSDAKKPDLTLFKQINKYARAGKWNAITNQPARWQYGEEAKQVYVTYTKLWDEKTRYCDRWPSFGRELDLVLRFVGLVVVLISISKIYDTVLPETYRYGYKYGVKQHFEEKHRREKEGGGHDHH